MTVLDLASDSALSVMLELVRDLSVARDPQAMLSAYARRINAIRPIDGYVSLSVRGLAPGDYKITRLITQTGDFDRSQDPWSRWQTIPINRDGFFGERIANGQPAILSNLNIINDAAVGDALDRFGSCMATPLFDDGAALNWAFFFREAPDGFEVEDLRQTLVTANLVGRATKHMLATQEAQRLNKRLDAQLQEIAEVQRNLLPVRTPRTPGLRIATSYLPSMIAGGDFYDFIELEEGRLGMVIGDVSGHGAGAAAISAMLHGVGYAFEGELNEPRDLLRFINKHMHAKRLSGRFVTMMYGIFDPEDRSFTYASAGHHPARLKRANDGVVTALESDSAWPVGVTAEIDPKPGRVRLEPGDAVVLFTDGIVEARSPAPTRKFFGVNRLDAALATCTGEPSCVIDTVHSALYAHTQSRWGEDDQTIVAMRVEDA